MKKVLLGVMSLMAVGLLVAGCKKKEDAPSYGGGIRPKAVDFMQEREQKQLENWKAANAIPQNLPKADASVPESNYVKLTSGNQIMFMCYALDSKPIEYEKIANIWSDNYARISDNFKRQDMLKSLTPEINKEIEKSKNNRYLVDVTDARNVIKHYDFSIKGFPLAEGLWAKDSRLSFADGSGSYNIQFTNGDPTFKYIKVDDDAVARKIEDMLTKFQEFKLHIYLYAQASSVEKSKVWAEIVKVRLTDSKGNDLLKH